MSGRLILLLNCGSSSVKSALIDAATLQRLHDIRIENIGTPRSRLRIDGIARPVPEDVDLSRAVTLVLQEQHHRLGASARLAAIGHRVVHGGERFVDPTVLTDDTLRQLEAIPLAPLHNPPALLAIRLARATYADIPHVAVFDTAFHRTLPRRAREYALPEAIRERFGIRRYGFHGISHGHVSRRVADHLQTSPDQLRIVSCHLGNGASVAAIEYGRSVETSMGMTPLEGLVMGTRAGDVDPGVLLHLLEAGDPGPAGLATLLNHQSGLRGLTGTEDLQEIERRAGEGDERCRLAIGIYAHRIRKYIGAYVVTMGGVDAIAFTGGVGEHSALIRHRCLQRLDFLGAVLDEDRNRDVRLGGSETLSDIAAGNSRVRLLVVQADEELAMAQDIDRLLQRQPQPHAHAHAHAQRSAGAGDRLTIPIAVSARHAHLSQATLDELFGAGYQLGTRANLSQPGQFAAIETVALIGPRGRIDGVRLMGPPRAQDQVEISRTDEFTLGVDAPVRLSGDLRNTPGITLEGPKGRKTIPHGLISARRHIHMSPGDAERFQVRHGDSVEVSIDSDGRDLTFGDVAVRVSPEFSLEMHLDTDEANAAGIERGDRGALVEHGEVRGAIRTARYGY